MEMVSILISVAHVAISVLVAVVIVKIYRWTRSRSALLGVILATGILARAALGVALFWISYSHLPVATGLQAGDGFWQLAPDARGYYEFAVSSAASQTFGQNMAVPSPFFVTTLAVWMLMVGMSPAAALLLNLLLYVGVVGLLVWCFQPVNEWRHDAPCATGVAAFSFSPVVLLHTSQPLKDGLTCALMTVGCLGIVGLGRLIYGRDRMGLPAMTLWLTSFLIAIFGIAGIRWYYGLMMWGCLVMVVTAFGVRGRVTRLAPYAAGGIAIVAVAWASLISGAGADASNIFGSYIMRGPSQLGRMMGLARTGFLLSGGGTNIVVPLRQDPGLSEVGRATPVTWSDHVRVIATGASILFLPLSIVQTVTHVTMPGGRGLIPIVDLDTIFQDVTIALVLTMLWTRRHHIGDWAPFVVFSLVLAAISALLLAYVVTNVGTLWRLRLMMSVPVWTIVPALSYRRHTSKGRPE
jgi:hypothetical protein